MITPGDFSAEDQQGLLVRQKSGDKIFISLFSKDAVKFNLQLNLTKNTKIGNLKSAVFYDINEAGALGLIVQNDKLENFLIYNFRRDKYFIKSKLMNDRKSYYDMNIGASFRFIVTSKDGSRHMDISYQLAQTSDMNIPLPYSLMGLGETNNYVENFQILSGNYYKDSSMFKDSSKRNFKDQTPIIPNTQMVIFKFLNDASKYEWYIDLIVLPMDSLVVIALVIVGVMLAILGVIIYLHVREVKEEQKETTKFKSWFA
jgi:integrin alpha FG-GAP repeat containing protein 1